MRTATLNRLLKNGNGHAPSTKPAKGTINPLSEVPAPVLATPPGAMTYLEAKAVCQLFGWPLPVDVGMNSGMFVVAATITPEVAQGLLVEHNKLNRKENSKHIDTIAKDMLSGCWHLNHQPIAVDADANVIDGQHRLAAVLKSGKPQPFLVVLYSRSLQVNNTIDTGRPRSYLDHIAMKGDFTLGNLEQSMLRFLHGMATGSYGQKASSAAMEMVREEYDEAIKFVLTHYRERVRGIVAAMLAAIASAYGHVPNDKLARFIHVLVNRTASESDPAEQTILQLIRNADRTNDHSAGAREGLFRKTQRAIRAYVDGQVLTKIFAPEKHMPMEFPVSVPKLPSGQLAG